MPKAPAKIAAEIKRRYTLDDRIYEIPWNTMPKHMQLRAIEKGHEKGKTILLPSVTSINGATKPPAKALEDFKAREVEAKGIEGARFALWLAGAQGTNVHQAIELFFDGKSLFWFDPVTGEKKYDDREWSCICNFMEFKKVYQPKIIKKESIVFSIEHGYAGTMDIAANLNNLKAAGDWKTSAIITRDYLSQTVAYAIADEEMHPDEPKYDTAFVVSLRYNNKAGWKAELLDRLEMMEYFQRFLHRLQVYRDDVGVLEDDRKLLPEFFIP